MIAALLSGLDAPWITVVFPAPLKSRVLSGGHTCGGEAAACRPSQRVTHGLAGVLVCRPKTVLLPPVASWRGARWQGAGWRGQCEVLPPSHCLPALPSSISPTSRLLTFPSSLPPSLPSSFSIAFPILPLTFPPASPPPRLLSRASVLHPHVLLVAWPPSRPPPRPPSYIAGCTPPSWHSRLGASRGCSSPLSFVTLTKFYLCFCFVRPP